MSGRRRYRHRTMGELFAELLAGMGREHRGASVRERERRSPEESARRQVAAHEKRARRCRRNLALAERARAR